MKNVQVISHGVTPVPETHIWNSKNKVVYGPIVSRRLRYSLGINLFPMFKVCSFNCAYCDMGKTPPSIVRQIEFQKGVVSGAQINNEIRKSLIYHREKGTLIDYITICGNGEATIHPDFVAVAEELIRLRDEMFPEKPLAILTNSYSVLNPKVVSIIEKLDEKIYKLDAGDKKTFSKISRPVLKKITFKDIVYGLTELNGIKISTAVVDAPTYSNISSIQGEYINIINKIKPIEIQLHNIDYPVFENDDKIRRLGVEDLVELGYYVYVHTEIPVKIVHSPVSLRHIRRKNAVKPSEKKNVLILDDMVDYLQSLTRALKNDFNIVTATTIEEAKGKVDSNVKVALIDFRLNPENQHDRSGLEYLRYVQRKYPEIKTILMTAYTDQFAIGDIGEKQANRFIAKPMNISVLRETLKELCQ